jgi:carboxyl-terminal processing protease
VSPAGARERYNAVMKRHWRLLRPAAVVTALAGPMATLLLSCGGDPAASSRFANKCVAPRAGIDGQGSLADEKAWLRLWTDELYLWYREVPNPDPAAYPTAVAYFDALKTPAVTPSGNPKDRFHFTIPTAQWLAQSQSGVEVGYGVEWILVASRPPREVRVGYLYPGTSPPPNIARGAKVLAVDGTDVTTGNPAPLNAGLFPATAGESHTFSILDLGATTPRPLTLTSANLTSTPVQNVKPLPGTTVGYMLFNDHIATSEAQLIQAINQLKAVQPPITELVLDIRYNGGGYLAIASELAFMIAGPAPTSGKTFEQLTFNDKYPTTDPVTGRPLTPEPFRASAVGLTSATPRGQALPWLGLKRVFVLTGPRTCSASESIINGLRGVDIQVIQIGSQTCGKPYGFYPADNCGTTYFSIQFKGVNAKGFGDYPDGFVPNGAGVAGVPGCQVADDFGHALGDPLEDRLSAALGYAAGQPCPSPTFALASQRTALSTPARSDEIAVKSPWRENRILWK